MADNYLEKQYEQYQARKAAWEKSKKYARRKAGVAPRAARPSVAEPAPVPPACTTPGKPQE